MSTGQIFIHNPTHKLRKSWSLKEGILSWRKGMNHPSNTISSNGDSEKSVIFEDDFCCHLTSKRNVWRALSPMELPEEAIYPLLSIKSLSTKLFASVTGPNTGILNTGKWNKTFNGSNALLKSWKTIESRKAHGVSISLYEKNAQTGKTNGDPIADAFVVRARVDSAFLAVADGVNWGRESMKAARLAITAVCIYLEKHLFHQAPNDYPIKDTRDAAQLLFESFSFAQEQIVQNTSGMTTLCVALVLPLQTNVMKDGLSCNSQKTESNQFALIVASVGDSKAYLLSKFHGIREITGQIEMDINEEVFTQSIIQTKDLRDAGGALGAVYKNGKPELNNLICAVTLCDPGDIVLVASDGLVDNFDPVITGIAAAESPNFEYVDENAEMEEQYPHNEQSALDKSQHSLNDHQILTPHKSWPSPPELRIWPAPPPIPGHYDRAEGVLNTKNTKYTSVPDSICATEINFTNQLELNWDERRQYTSKEIERVWHELEANSVHDFHSHTIVGDRQESINTLSSRDLCNALLRHTYQVTNKRRNFLEDPAFAHFRVSRLMNSSIKSGIESHPASPTERQKKWFSDTLRSLPGKLDHATVVAYEIGTYHGDENEVYEATEHKVFPSPHSCAKSHNGNTGVG